MSASKSLSLKVALVSSSLFAIRFGVLQSLALALLLVVCATAVAGVLGSSVSQSSFVGGFVVLICGVAPGIVFVTVLLGGLSSVPAKIFLAFVGAVLLVLFVKNFSSGSSSNEIEVLLPLLTVVLLSLVTKMWFFLTPLVAGLLLVCLVNWFSQRILNSNLRIAVRVFAWSALLGSALLSHLLSRAAFAEASIFRTTDQYFRASIGSGVVHFGIDENMGSAGQPIRYHWLSEGLVSFIGRLVGVSAIESVVWLSPFLGSLAAACTAYWLVNLFIQRKWHGVLGAVMLLVLSLLLYSQGINILKTTEMGQFWGTPLFLFGVGLLFLFLESRLSIVAFFLVLWFPLLVMTNTTLGLSFACGVGVLLVVEIFKSRIPFLKAVSIIGGLLVLLMVLRQTLLTSTSLEAFTPRFGWDDPFGFSFAFGYTGFNPMGKIVIGLAFLAALWFQGGGAVGLRSSTPIESSRSQLAIFAASAMLPAFFFSVLDGSDQYRFLKPLLIIGPISFALASEEVVRVLRTRMVLNLSILFASALALGFQADVLAKSFGGLRAMFPRVSYVLLFVGVPLMLFLANWLVWRKDREGPQLRLFGFMGLFSLVVSSSALIFGLPGQVEYARTIEAPSVVNAKRIACLHHLKELTDREEIIASNMWRYSDDVNSEKWFIVSAVTERRTLVDGPFYVENPQSESLKNRMAVTEAFASDSSIKSSLETLQIAGVEYFVVDTRWTRRQSWQPYAERIYSNSDCIVLRLNEPVN